MQIKYSNDGSSEPYQIVYMVKESGARLVAGFDSEPAAWRFFNKLRRSKNVVVIRHPNWKS